MRAILRFSYFAIIAFCNIILNNYIAHIREKKGNSSKHSQAFTTKYWPITRLKYQSMRAIRVSACVCVCISKNIFRRWFFHRSTTVKFSVPPWFGPIVDDSVINTTTTSITMVAVVVPIRFRLDLALERRYD